MFNQFDEMNRPLNAAGLKIKWGTGPTINTNNNCRYIIDNKLCFFAGSTDLAPLSGIVVPAGNAIVIGAMADINWLSSYNAGNAWEIATRPYVDFSIDKILPDERTKALLGLVIIANNSVNPWTGSTDALDASGITAIFIDAVDACI